MGDKGGEPKGGGSYEGKLAELTTGVGEMNLNDLDDDVHDHIDNSTTTYHRTDYYSQGGAGASKTPCRTPGAIGDVKGEPSEKTLQNTGKGWQQRVVNQGDLYSPSTLKPERDDKNRPPRRKRSTRFSLRRSQKYLDEHELAMADKRNPMTPTTEENLLRSELRQVEEEREAGENEDVHKLAADMAAKRPSRRTRNLLGSELGQPKVW